MFSKIYWSFIPSRTHRFAKFVDALGVFLLLFFLKLGGFFFFLLSLSNILAEYIWQIYLFTSILRFFAVAFAGLSILIVWSEITLTVRIYSFSFA